MTEGTQNRRKRHLALCVLCLGVLMIVLDTTIVTVALPSVVADLHVSARFLPWMLNAYMLTYGGFMLLGGRLGDLYSRQRLFLAGIVLFTLASLSCGVAHTPAALFIARAAQGVGGAVVTAVSLSLITTLFSDPNERAKAIGVYGFVYAAGGGVGELLGGALTQVLSWRWIFLVNLPIGITVVALSILLLPRDASPIERRQLDISGAVVMTTVLSLMVYALANGNAAGWTSLQMLGLTSGVALLLLLFGGIEHYVREPLIPLPLFRLRNFVTANIIGVAWSAGSFAWFVICALYLQRVLDYSPLQVGLAFLPAELLIAAFSLGLAAAAVERFGIRAPLTAGLLLAAAGLSLFSRAPLGGLFLEDVLPGMVLLGLGTGMASSPLLLAAMSDIDANESGLASGIINTSFMMGGALGLAVLASLADRRSEEILHSGVDAVSSLNAGYQLAFLVGALLTGSAAALSAFLRIPKLQQDGQVESIPGANRL